MTCFWHGWDGEGRGVEGGRVWPLTRRALPTPSQITRYSIKAHLKCGFQTTPSYNDSLGHRSQTRGQEWSQQQVRESFSQDVPCPPQGRDAASPLPPGALSGGPGRAPRGEGEDSPHGEAWEQDAQVTQQEGDPGHQEAVLGEDDLRPLSQPSPITPQKHPACWAPSGVFTRHPELEIFTCVQNLEMRVHWN